MLQTTYISATQLAATIPAFHLVDAGTYQVGVFNPTPGGGTSGTSTFAVTLATVNAVPTIASIAPSDVPISSVDMQIAITGANFVAASSATIGSQGLASEVTSSTQMLAVVPASYLTASGTVPIGVYSPAPGGGFSPATVGLSVGTVNPVPILASLTPPSAMPGDGTLALGLSGGSFVPGAEAFFGSVALATTYVSSTSLEATLPANLLVNEGSAAVLVVNPDPGGGESNAVDFAISSSDGGDDASDDAGDGGHIGVGLCGSSPTSCVPAGAQCVDGVCYLEQGQACTDSSQCDPRMVCSLSACNATIGTTVTANSSQCSVAGSQVGMQTCAPGYVCEHTATGIWGQAIPNCGGTTSPCVLAVGAGQACSIPQYSTTSTSCALRASGALASMAQASGVSASSALAGFRARSSGEAHEKRLPGPTSRTWSLIDSQSIRATDVPTP